MYQVERIKGKTSSKLLLDCESRVIYLCKQEYKPEEREENLIFPHIDQFKTQERRKAILADYGSDRISHELERRSLDTEGEIL